MQYAVLGGVVCAFALGALISGVICWKDGYDKAIRDLYDHRRRKRV